MSLKRFFQTAEQAQRSRKTGVRFGSRRQQGFTLIEFVVASAIGMIVLMAAGATYFTTQRLNSVATARLNSQQDLRTAANLIIRDARQAGTFGCLSLGGIPGKVVAIDDRADNPTKLAGEPDDANIYGVRVMKASDFLTAIGMNNNSGLTAAGNALIFTYGDGNVSYTQNLPSGDNLQGDDYQVTGDLSKTTMESGPLVLSSCNRLLVLPKPNSDYSFTEGKDASGVVSGKLKIQKSVELSTSNAAVDTEKFIPSQLQISRLAANAYLVATVNNVRGLYRFSLGDGGVWEGPQLLIAGVAENNPMKIEFRYQKIDNTQCTGDGNTPETFTAWTETLAHNNGTPNLPTLLRITLNMDPAVVNNGETAGSSASANTTSVPPYVIDATIRGGNVCGNRGA